MPESDFKKHTCACCGKIFVIGFVESWAYKDGSEWFCKYSCMAKVRREREEERERKKAAFLSSYEGSYARKNYIRDRNMRLVNDRAQGMSLSRAAKKYGITIGQVKNICNNEN